MSQGNVEVVRHVYAAFNDRRLDTLAALLDPGEFRWHPNPEDPEREPRKGYDESVAFLEAQRKALPGLHTEIEEMIDTGSDVVAVVRHTARVPGSDSEIERQEVHVWSLRDGKVQALREYTTREEALKAAGLSE